MALNINKNSPINRWYNSKRINFFYLFFSGLIIIAASAAVYLFVLRESFGSFSLKDLIPSEKNLKNIISNGTSKIAIFAPEKGLEDSAPDEEISLWEKIFSDCGLRYDLLDQRTREVKDYLNYSLIIVPSSVSLDRAQTEGLKEFYISGGSLLTAGISPLKNGLNEIFNIRLITVAYRDTIKKERISFLRVGSSLTSGIEPGTKIYVSGRRGLYTALPGFNVVPLGFYSAPEDTVFAGLSAAYGFNNKGRFVWLDFGLTSISESGLRSISKLIFNSVNWLIKNPSVHLNNFPANYSAGAILAPIIADSINYVYNFLKILSDHDIEASFFIGYEKAIENLPLTSELPKFGEVGVYYYSRPRVLSDNFSFYNLLRKESEREAINDLKESKRKIEQITGSKCMGCIIYPEFSFDTGADLAAKAGFGYLVSSSSKDHPAFIVNKSFITFNPFFKENIGDSGKFIVNHSIDSLLFVSGLMILNFKIREFDKLKNIKEASDLIGYLKKKNFWITTASRFQRWQQEKNNLSFSVVRKGAKRVYLQVSNSGNITAEKFAVYVDLNEISGIGNIYLSPELVPGKKVKILNIDSHGIVTLLFDNLKAGESLNFYIDYNTFGI